MKSSTDLASEQGSAIVDWIGFGILLQIPVLMFATVAIANQQQAFAIEAIARHGVRAHVLWPDRTSTSRVIAELVRDFGIAPDRVIWRLNCLPDPNCMAARNLVEIEVRIGEQVAYAMQRF